MIKKDRSLSTYALLRQKQNGISKAEPNIKRRGEKQKTNRIEADMKVKTSVLNSCSRSRLVSTADANAC